MQQRRLWRSLDALARPVAPSASGAGTGDMVAMAPWRALLVAVVLVGRWRLGCSEPFSTHTRSCVSGQLCVISGIEGTGLADGDSLVLIASSFACGQLAAAKVEGTPGNFGRTLPAVGRGSAFTWQDPIMPDGGPYNMCWCGAASGCTNIQAFRYLVGTIAFTGPKSGLEETCIGGHLCKVDGIEGAYLHNDDSVMILEGCGSSAFVDGFPNLAKTTASALAGSEHSWGQVPTAALGGQYDICWCARGAECAEGIQHRKKVGTLTVVGPRGAFANVCTSFSSCTWNGVIGTELDNGDRMMILNECGSGLMVPGFPSSGIATASGGGGSYSFGADNVIKAGGAEYDMCWCRAADGRVCTGPANFLVRAGTLTVVAPRSDHDVSCIKGNVCEVRHFQGIGLANGDKVMVLLSCGAGSPPGGLPSGGVLVALDFGHNFTTWSGPVTASELTYRLCWCSNSWSCSSPSDFKMDAGAFRITSVASGQQRSCHAFDGCQVIGLAGANQRSGDLMMILPSCGSADAYVNGWTHGGLSLPATGQGKDFSWGLVERNAAEPRAYRMCWCPFGHFSSCNRSADFTVDAGTMTLKGPMPMSTNASCSAMQIPSCIVGQFLQGAGFSWGKDRVLLVPVAEECRESSGEAGVGGGGGVNSLGKEVADNGLIYWDASDLPFGGIWKLCYCADYDSPLDKDSLPCSSAEDFPVAAGVVAVTGAYPGQRINCTRNQVCTFSLFGENLDKDVHKIAVGDDDTQCGSRTNMDTATRRRRDVTGNPYPAVSSVSENEIVFTVAPVQALATFTLCLCVPPPGGNPCGDDLRDYDQIVGDLDIRGAYPDQVFICGRGGYCIIKIAGRHLGAKDFVKIVNMTTECSGLPELKGFYNSLLPANVGVTQNLAVFELGKVTASGFFKVCYCAGLSGCTAMDKYNHLAGLLEILDPLSNLVLFGATATSITVSLYSQISTGASDVRCATSEFEPTTMPNAAGISKDMGAGLGAVGLGMGMSDSPTVVGMNTVQIFLKEFVRPSSQYRIWCVETSSQSFILPGHSGGLLIITPEAIEPPRLLAYPSYLWQGAMFYTETSKISSDAVTMTTTPPGTMVRVSSGSSETVCNRALYANASANKVTNQGKSGQSIAVVMSTVTLVASTARPFICFFSGPSAVGIALTKDKLVVHAEAPTFTQKRLDGQAITKVYRGLLMQVLFTNVAPTNGLLHWVPAGIGADCRGASRAPPAAQIVTGANTSFFKFGGAVGEYTMCYLGTQSESTTVAPFNGIGSFVVTDTITAIVQDPALPSTRSSVCVEIEVRVPGTVTCLTRATPAAVTAADFSGGAAYLGRAGIVVGPPAAGGDPEFPRRFPLMIPLLYYQQTQGPLYVWCHHSLAEDLVYPGNADGAVIPLQKEEPVAVPEPTFLWTGAKFQLTLSNTPDIDSKLIGFNQPALPGGWTLETTSDAETGAMQLRYKDSSGSLVEEHPVYTAWKQSGGSGPCAGSNISRALPVTADGNTKTESWFRASAMSPFACYWASQASFPHLVKVLNIRAQPPTFQLEVGGQLMPYVYRGVGVTYRMQYISNTGGRILVVRKADFDAFGGNCQDMNTARRLQAYAASRAAADFSPAEGPVKAPAEAQTLATAASTVSAAFPATAPALALETASATVPLTALVEGLARQRGVGLAKPRRLQSAGSSCTMTRYQKPDALQLFTPAEALFPDIPWGVEAAEGLNCSRDFKLYVNPVLTNVTVLADAAHGRYFLITSNKTLLSVFLPTMYMLKGYSTASNFTCAVTHYMFSTLSNLTSEHWVLSNDYCDVQNILGPASPMYEEGAENLDLSTYSQAALNLTGFDFTAVVYFAVNSDRPNNSGPASVLRKGDVCAVLQPPAAPPPRPEPPPGYTVTAGSVFVPAVLTGTGSFLHTDAAGEYVLCYVGDEGMKLPIFNPIGEAFASKDVLPVDLFSTPETPESNTQRAYLNITSMLHGVVRCIALLRDGQPPTHVDQIFFPDTSNKDFVASSDPTQFDVSGTSSLISMVPDPQQAPLIVPSESFAAAQPTMYVWCAHDKSTVLYPRGKAGYKLNLKASPPSTFHYRFGNGTAYMLELTLDLDITALDVTWADPNFPVNRYNKVKFTASPTLPKGLVLDPATGTISGMPEATGNVTRQITASSLYPPKGTSSVTLVIDVRDVLGLRTRSVNVDHVVFTISPRSTDIFKSERVFILIHPKTTKFANIPTEFFCLLVEGSGSEFLCRQEAGKCCCSGPITEGQSEQDVRISTAECGLTQRSKYHASGIVRGMLEGTTKTGLRSSKIADVNIPAERPSEMKRPVAFDLVLRMDPDGFDSDKGGLRENLAREISSAVAIPAELVIVGAPSKRKVSGDGGAGSGRRLATFTVMEVAFFVEPRCLEQRRVEIEMISFGIDVQEGCNLVAPEEYMDELSAQLSDAESAIFYRKDLPNLRLASVEHSFSYARVMWFCNREPLWLYGAVVQTEEECPYDMVKMGFIAIVAATLAFCVVLIVVCYLSADCAAISFLYKTRVLDMLTPLLALYTTLADCLWLFMLKNPELGGGVAGVTKANPYFDGIFMIGICHLFVCFCVNMVSLRITITIYIWDTPWWRRNRKRLRPILFLSCVTPRFFRITRANLSGFDATHIHFGTPSKMSVVFSNLGLVMLLQDVPQLLMHLYVWLVWRNQGPRVALACLILSAQSIAVGILHHIFSRSQRAAYERVVKLLGVRRLTAGFFDVSTAVGQRGAGLGSPIESMRKSPGDKGAASASAAELEDENQQQDGSVLDPRKLDPIQAAMYVSQMYEKEARAGAPPPAIGDEDESIDGHGSAQVKKHVYPKALYQKMKKFYAKHDPALINHIEQGDVEVDEGKLDADLKQRFGVGLDSIK